MSEFDQQKSPYEHLGGEAGVRKLVARFYQLMDSLTEAQTIRALHPNSLAGSEQKLFMFLSGWLGGPPLFVEAYGHPRLRGRHLPFAIDESARDAWMLCMRRALGEQLVDDALLREQLISSLYNTADFMRNQTGGADSGE